LFATLVHERPLELNECRADQDRLLFGNAGRACGHAFAGALANVAQQEKAVAAFVEPDQRDGILPAADDYRG
jgi:hypothetical protein